MGRGHDDEWAVIVLTLPPMQVLHGHVAPEPHSQRLEILERVSSSSMAEEGEGAGGGGAGLCGSSSSMGPCHHQHAAGPPPPPVASVGIEKIADFCFPQGGKLELAPLEQLDLHIGPHRDQTHVLQFTDSQGATTYGLCITIHEAWTEGPPGLHRTIRDLRAKHEAAQKIQTFIRRRSGSLEGTEAQLNNLLEEEGGWVRRGLLNHVRTRMKKLQLSSSGWGTPRQAGTPVNRVSSSSNRNSPRFTQ